MKKYTIILLVSFFCFGFATAQNGITLEYNCESDCIDLSIDGGESPYDVVWNVSSGQLGFSSQVSGLSGDSAEDNGREDLCDNVINGASYTAVVTDALCGVAEASITIDKCECLNVELEDFQNVSNCFLTTGEPGSPGGASSSCDGSIDIGIDTDLNYQVMWQGPNGFTSTSEDISGLCPGFYRATIISNRCEKVFAYNLCCCKTNVDDPGEFGSTFTLCDRGEGDTKPISLEGSRADSPNSRIIISVSGGGENIKYQWTGPDGFTSEEMNISNLSLGTYCVRAFDGCSEDSRCFTIVDCNKTNLNVEILKENSCTGFCVGEVFASVSGGDLPYNYSWSNQSENENQSGLCSGQYCVTITDITGCVAMDCIQIDEVEPKRVNCSYECNGSIVDDDAFGRPTLIEDPNNCSRSLRVCSDDHSIVLETGLRTFSAVYGGNCVINFFNTTSGNVCASLTGVACSQCVFGNVSKVPTEIKIANCKVSFCNWPSINTHLITHVEEFENVVQIFEAGEIIDDLPNDLCGLKIWDNCDSPDPFIDIIVNCTVANAYGTAACSFNPDEFLQGLSFCGSPGIINELDTRSNITAEDYRSAIEQSYGPINQSTYNFTNKFDAIPKPEIMFDSILCLGEIIFQSEVEDSVYIRIYNETAGLVYEEKIWSTYGENKSTIKNFENFILGENHVFFIDFPYSYQLYEHFLFDLACTNSLLKQRSRFAAANSYDIIPNPFSETVIITNGSNDVSEILDIELFDINGKKVAKYPKVLTNQALNLGFLNNGIYIFKLTDADSQKVLDEIKVVKIN